MRISDWSSDVCSSDLNLAADARAGRRIVIALRERRAARIGDRAAGRLGLRRLRCRIPVARPFPDIANHVEKHVAISRKDAVRRGAVIAVRWEAGRVGKGLVSTGKSRWA